MNTPSPAHPSSRFVMAAVIVVLGLVVPLGIYIYSVPRLTEVTASSSVPLTAQVVAPPKKPEVRLGDALHLPQTTNPPNTQGNASPEQK